MILHQAHFDAQDADNYVGKEAQFLCRCRRPGEGCHLELALYPRECRPQAEQVRFVGLQEGPSGIFEV